MVSSQEPNFEESCTCRKETSWRQVVVKLNRGWNYLDEWWSMSGTAYILKVEEISGAHKNIGEYMPKLNLTWQMQYGWTKLEVGIWLGPSWLDSTCVIEFVHTFTNILMCTWYFIPNVYMTVKQICLDSMMPWDRWFVAVYAWLSSWFGLWVTKNLCGVLAKSLNLSNWSDTVLILVSHRW